MSSSIHIVTVDNSTSTAKTLISTVLKELKKQNNVVHVANCENITHVKTVLTSLIVPPSLLVTTSSFFEDEQEEVREIAQRVAPNTRLMMVPPGLKAQEGDAKAVEYLVDQITEFLDV